MKHQSLFAGLSLLGLLTTSHAAPVELTTAHGRGGDTSVRGGDLRARNFGSLDILRVRNSTTLNDARKAYLRFDLGTVASPARSATDATLALTIAPAEGSSSDEKDWTFQVYGLKDGDPAESWPEASTNWDNAPANDTNSGNGVLENAQPLGTFGVTGKGGEGQNVLFSSPNLLRFIQADTNGTATFIISRVESGVTDTDNVVHIFVAKESTKGTPPTLRLNFPDSGGQPQTTNVRPIPERPIPERSLVPERPIPERSLVPERPPVPELVPLPNPDVPTPPNHTVVDPNAPLRLFLIGNSFSQNATRFLPQMAQEVGRTLVIGRAEAPSHSLEMHWEAVEAGQANAKDPKARIYGGKSLKELLGTGTWDIVTIQQGSWQSADLASYRPFARKLHDYIKKLQPNAEVVLHQTWAYRGDAPQFAPSAPNKLTISEREMWEKSRAAYQTIAGELKVRLIPVGDAFWRVDSHPKWGYKKDLSYNFANAVYPLLPAQTTSLHAGYAWQSRTKLVLDPRHASEAGSYLGSLVWSGILFKQDPAEMLFTPRAMPRDFAYFLRQTASAVVRETRAPAQVSGAAR